MQSLPLNWVEHRDVETLSYSIRIPTMQASKSALIALLLAVFAAGTVGCESLNASRTAPNASEIEESQSGPPAWLTELCPSAPSAGTSSGEGVWCIESSDQIRKFQFGDLRAFLVHLEHDDTDAYQIRLDFPDVVTSEGSDAESALPRTLAALELRTRPFSSLHASDVQRALQHGLIATLRTSSFDAKGFSLPPPEQWDAGKHTSRIDAQLRAFTPPAKPDDDARQPSGGKFAMTGTFKYPAGGFADSEPSTVHLAVDVDDLPVIDAETAEGSYRDRDGSTHEIAGAWATLNTRNRHITLHYANQSRGQTNWHVTHLWQVSTKGGLARGTIDLPQTGTPGDLPQPGTPGDMSYHTAHGHPLTVPSWPAVDTATHWPTGPGPDTAPFRARVDWPSNGTISVRNGRYCKSQTSTCPKDSVADLPVELDIRRASTLHLNDLEPLDVADAQFQPSSTPRTDARKATETSLPKGSTASIVIDRTTRSTRVSFEDVWAQSRPFPFNGHAASAWQQMNAKTRSLTPTDRQLLVEFPALADASETRANNVSYVLDVRRFDSGRRQFPARLVASDQCDPDSMRVCLEGSDTDRGILGTFLLETIDGGDTTSTLTGRFRSVRRSEQAQIEVELDGVTVAQKQLDGLTTGWVHRLKTDERDPLPSGWITVEPDREIISVYAQRTRPDSQTRGHHVYRLEDDSPGLQTGAYVTDIKWRGDEHPVERATVIFLRTLDDRTVELAEYWLDTSGASSLGIDAEGPVELNESRLRDHGTQMAEFTTNTAWRRPTLSTPVLLEDLH